MVRTLLASVLCLALGLIGGFYLGRNSQPGTSAVILPPGTPEQAGSRSRTVQRNRPPAPGPGAQSSGQVPSVQPPPVGATGSPSTPGADASSIALPIDNLQPRYIQDTF